MVPGRRETIILFLLFQFTAQKITLNFLSLGSKSTIYYKAVQKIRRLIGKREMLNWFILQFMKQKHRMVFTLTKSVNL